MGRRRKWRRGKGEVPETRCQTCLLSICVVVVVVDISLTEAKDHRLARKRVSDQLAPPQYMVDVESDSNEDIAIVQGRN
jgi:hypothetical protein